MNYRPGFLLSIGVLLVVVLGHSVFARSTPRLNLITPRGVQRGHQHVLRFTGQRLAQAKEVFLYEPGIAVLEIKQVDGNNVDVTIDVGEECRLGEHVAQLRTVRGISDYRSFFVGAFAQQNEVEPNNALSAAQALEQNVTVAGVVQNEDVDVFRIAGRKGQRLSIEIEAIRLGYMFDPFVAVLNEQNFEIAVSDDSMLHRQDSVISTVLPADGNYFVQVRESSYGGNGNCRYRLHIGDFARPLVAYPAGGAADSQIDLTLLGDPMGPLDRTVELPEEWGLRQGIDVVDHNVATPSAVPFRISSLPNVLESEPNDDRRKIEAVHTTPTAFNGIIATPNDQDYWKFSANKGDNLDVECFSRRLRSGLDPVMNIYDALGKSLAGDDDSRRPDCYLRFQVPENDEYFIRIRDHLRRGQDDFVYRVEVRKVSPALRISIPRVDRYSQLRQQISVPKGNRFATLISATRQGFGGPLELIQPDLPDGMTMEAPVMMANLNTVPVVFSASQDAPIAGRLVDLKARHANPKRNIVGGFLLRADFALGPPNNATFHTCDVDRLACAVTERIPFRLDIVEPQAPLVRGGSMQLEVVAHRDEGFDAPIVVQFPFRPPGLGTKPQLEIKAGQSKAYYPLNANGNAQIGSWPVYVIGQSDVKGPTWASSQLATLEIAEPYVTMEMNRSICTQGEEASIHCTLNQHKPFEGEATAEILGIPPHISVAPLKFTKETKSLSFSVQTNEKSPLGKHRGLFCRVTIPMADETMVSTAARSELHINKPPVKTEAVTKATQQAPKLAKPKSKPLSRLEQLRAAAKDKRK